MRLPRLSRFGFAVHTVGAFLGASVWVVSAFTFFPAEASVSQQHCEEFVGTCVGCVPFGSLCPPATSGVELQPSRGASAGRALTTVG